MNKKLFTFISLILFSISFLNANVNYKLDILTFDPIYKEYFADRARPDFSLSQINYYEGFPDRVLQDTHVDTGGEEITVTAWPFNETIKPENKFISLKLGDTIALGRNTFTFDSFLSPVAFDFSMQALLQNFYRGSFDDNVSFDGIYFFGGTFKIGNILSFRIGKHHYCSHYGDATLKRIDGNITSDFDDFGLTYKYVRMNTNVFGLSLDLTPNFRIYGEYDVPPKDIYSVRPDMFAPNFITRNGQPINEDYPDSYKARIITVGVEFTYPIFKKLGNTTIGYDLHMYEEGKVIYDHVNGGAVYFDEDAPWELEHNVKLGQVLDENISLEIAYHNGRSVMNSYYFLHTETLTIGFRFNPDYTVNLINTEK